MIPTSSGPACAPMYRSLASMPRPEDTPTSRLVYRFHFPPARDRRARFAANDDRPPINARTTNRPARAAKMRRCKYQGMLQSAGKPTSQNWRDKRSQQARPFQPRQTEPCMGHEPRKIAEQRERVYHRINDCSEQRVRLTIPPPRAHARLLFRARRRGR